MKLPSSSHRVHYRFDITRVVSFVWFEQPTEMENTLKPPSTVKGMVKLDRSQFSRTALVQALLVNAQKLRAVLKFLKKYKLKTKNVKPVVELDKLHSESKTHRLVLLDPSCVKTWDDFPSEIQKQLKEAEVSETDIENYNIQLSYDNWGFQDVMAAVLPDDIDGVSGFSEIGHIAHFNLRDKALPYKNLIGEVLLDKVSTVKTVVNKLNSIDNTYRTFEMELLAGEENYITQTKENGYTYELDFSKVYWNSRLGNEHDQLTKDLKSTDVVFDVFAGIGPFAVPASKHKATVFANDLNPHSYEALVKNVQINKCKGAIKCFNLDGRDFIQTCVKEQLSKIYAVHRENEMFENVVIKDISGVYVIMNLPAIATTFLDAFHGLLCPLEELSDTISLPVVHCYCFTNLQEAVGSWNGDVSMEIKHRVINTIGGLSEEEIDVRFVRNVAPQKDMMCITFKLRKDILLGKVSSVKGELCKKTMPTDDDVDGEPPLKQAKVETGS